MFGIETYEILIFLRQLGLAVAGAAAFWGSVFLFFARRAKDNRSAVLWQGVSQKLLFIFFPALFIFGIVWAGIAISLCVFCANAHEGISIAKTSAELMADTHGQYGLYIALMGAGILGFTALLLRPRSFYRRIDWFYLAFFIAISVFLLYPWTPLESLRYNFSSALHGWHSILTFGSVVLVDFLFIALRFNLRPYLIKIFPIITMGIWIGLGLDFISSGLIFQEEFFPADRVLVMQTLVGIIIVNGVILSGPISRAILSYQQRMRTESLPRNLSTIVGMSGAVSIAGWASITALDSFRTIIFSYWQLLLLYALFVAVLFFLRGLLTNIRIGV
jgi:hypothetical protein